MAIEEAKDLATLPLDELIRNLKVYEMILASDGVASKPIKEKKLPVALKANVTRGQTSNDSVCQDGSDEEEEFNSMMKNLWKFFKKGNRYKDGHGNSSKGVGSSRGKHNCYVCGSKNHFVDDCPKAKMKKALCAKHTANVMLLTYGSPSWNKGEQRRSRGSTCKDIYFLPLQRYQPSNESPRYHLFVLTKGGEGKLRVRAHGREDKLLKLKIRKLTMHASSKGASLSCFVVISFAFRYIFVIIKKGEIVGELYDTFRDFGITFCSDRSAGSDFIVCRQTGRIRVTDHMAEFQRLIDPQKSGTANAPGGGLVAVLRFGFMLEKWHQSRKDTRLNPRCKTPTTVTNTHTTTSVTNANSGKDLYEGVTDALDCTLMQQLVSKDGSVMNKQLLYSSIARSNLRLVTCKDNALTWWNTHVKTLSLKLAHAMPMEVTKKIDDRQICPSGLKLRSWKFKMWNVEVKCTDVGTYSQRFQGT
ncbi:UBN2 domain-containing protein [Tanacetum coccineum]|uniref:UBN2 domain-containing protein n=1 Tax=Tanacetum coccineum TaxID=301880 RepID=A0ABQ4Z363_9ASTR